MDKEFGNERRLAKKLNFRKRYSLPVLIALYSKKGLTFNQIYDLSANIKGGTPSRQSINRALKELLEMEYIEKRAKLMNRRACITYMLTENARKVMEKYF